MIEEFKKIANKYKAPFCEKCGQIDLTLGLGDSCLFCIQKFNPIYNENQLIYSLDVLKYYFLNSTLNENEEITNLKIYFSKLDLNYDYLVDDLFEFNKLIKRIDKIAIEDKGFFRINPIWDIIVNLEAIKSKKESLALIELGVLMFCLIIVKNSI